MLWILRTEFCNIISGSGSTVAGGWTTDKAILEYINNQYRAGEHRVGEHVDNATPADMNRTISKLSFPDDQYQCPITNTYVLRIKNKRFKDKLYNGRASTTLYCYVDKTGDTSSIALNCTIPE